jgi:TonB dependent receptor.
LDESRYESYSYTMRAQVNFNRIFGKHAISALGGAERRLVRRTGAQNYYMGYDDNSLGVKPINPLAMSPINGTEALLGSFNWVYGEYNALTHTEDRYVSFYANGSYTFDERYSLTGSIRIDQSNLFGTDPKYQYRPLWSVGGSWQIANEPFMEDCMWLNRLNLRMTYGVGGNVPKDAGPYMTVVDSGYNEWVGDFGSYIQNPPNSQLRWEKTASTNVGIDFSAFNSRLSGSIDYYYKKTTDLLGNRNADPTLGWASLLQNYGSMFNRGVELSLQSVNIQNKNFTWGTNLMFSYNKNELTNLEGTKETVFYYSAYNVAAVGYPINSVFSYRYAGLDPTNGNVLVYNKEGEKVSKVSSIDDMVYSGTRTPKYTASLKNFFSYRDF